MSTTIISGKAKKNNTVQIKFIDPEKELEAEQIYKNAKPHLDLINSLRALAPHGAFRCEMVDDNNENQIKVKRNKEKVEMLTFADEDLKDKFTVTGFTISNKGLITIHMSVALKTKSLNLNCPAISLEDETENGYPYAQDLSMKIDACKAEFVQFFEGTKMAVDPQLDIFKDGQAATKVKIDTPTDESLSNFQNVDITKRIEDSKATADATRKRGEKQTPANPSGSPQP